MDVSIGDNRAEKVILSNLHNMAFILDKYDHIWIYKYGDNALQYDGEKLLNVCETYGASWLSVALDDQQDQIGLYFLLKHNAAEFQPYCISQENYNDLGSSLGLGQGCSDIQSYIETDIIGKYIERLMSFEVDDDQMEELIIKGLKNWEFGES